MIIKASERGNARNLSAHLLNEHDGNEHINVHELRGFMSGDLAGALDEAHAISRGSKCKNYLFSLSMNPPANEDVSIEIFEDAINRIEQKNNLIDHPRAIIFHEKQSRRHAHVVWSRIDAETMTAKNLSHYKAKLQDISRELYLENNWRMPDGLTRKNADPRNYSLSEYQQSKRMKADPRELKGSIQDAYASCDNAASFSNALKERGFTLANGRRGVVAVTPEGEVLSISRYVGKKAKEVREKLADTQDLPSVDTAKLQTAKDMRGTFIRHTKESRTLKDQAKDKLEQNRQRIIEQQRFERTALEAQQKERWIEETRERSERLNSGLRGLWQRITGQHAKIQAQNVQEALNAQERDKAQQNDVIQKHMNDQRAVQEQQDRINKQHEQTIEQLRDDQAKARETQRALQEQLKPQTPSQTHSLTPESSKNRDGPELDR